jgi:hypothetical protein
MAQSRRSDGKPETSAEKRFFDLRESGYRGPIDEHGHRVDNPEAQRRWREGECR